MKLETIVESKRLRILDFDDTLVKSNSRVILNKTKFLTPAQFAVYVPMEGDTFDFSEFSKLIDPKEIKHIVREFQLMIAAASAGHSRVEILTARNTPEPVNSWLENMGIRKIPVKALANADPKAKADYIEKKILDGFDDIVFFDDSINNIRAVETLQKKYPKIKIRTRHVKI